jgi:hypothetical protein
VYTDIRYPPRTSKQQLTIGKMVKDRAKKEKKCGMQHAKTDSGRHIDNINKVSEPNHHSALVMRTTCPRRAQTLGDPSTMIPILEMHLEITHAITGDIELT